MSAVTETVRVDPAVRAVAVRWTVGAGVVVVAGAGLLAGPVSAIAAAAAITLAGAVMILARTVPWIGLVALAISSPLMLTELRAGIRIFHIASLVAIFFVLLGMLWRRHRVPVPALVALAGLATAAFGLSGLMSPSPLGSAPMLADYILGWGVASCATLAIARHRNALLWILRGWIVGGLVAIAPALVTGSAGEAIMGGVMVEGRATGIFAQPNDFGEFSMIMIFVSICLMVCSSRALDMTLATAGLAAGAGGTLASMSRGTWIGLALGLIVVAIMLPRIGRWLGVVAVTVAAAVGGAAAAGVPFAAVTVTRLATISGGPSSSPEDHRDQIWAFAEELWKANPTTGVGLGQFRDVARSASSEIAPNGAYHAHNALLQVGAESGLIGLASVVVVALATLAVTFGAWASARRNGDEGKQGAVAVIFAAMIAAAGHGMVDYVYTNPMLVTQMWLLFGLLVGAAAMPSRPGPRSPTGKPNSAD